MSYPMDRTQAIAYLKEIFTNPNMVNHCIAVELIMVALAEHFGEDVEKWSLAGLLHDVDYAETAKDPLRHGLLSAEMLEAKGFEGELVYAVKVHNDALGLPRISLFDKALFAADSLSGLIVAGALIHPSKKLAPLNTEFILKRFHEKSFARGANREHIATCSEMGLSLEEFITLGLTAMQEHAAEIGL